MQISIDTLKDRSVESIEALIREVGEITVALADPDPRRVVVRPEGMGFLGEVQMNGSAVSLAICGSIDQMIAFVHESVL